MRPDALIAGAGVIGCAIARELSARGLRPVIVEAGLPGREASWASAGMIAPQDPVNEPFLDLCLRGRDLYPDWVRALEQESGIDLGFRQDGSVEVALDETGLQQLAASAAWSRRVGLPVEVLDAEELSRRVPGVSRKALGGVFAARDAWIDNRRLMEALVGSLLRRGVEIRSGEPVLRFTGSTERVDGVRTPRGRFQAGSVVDAAGAWSSMIAGVPRGELRVRPVRGQMILLEVDGPPLAHIIDGGGIYLVPRGPRHILIGSTVERVGFRRAVTAASVSRLLRRAIRIMPALSRARIVETWCGFRPHAGRLDPVVGPSRRAGLWYATGHYREGILLAPATARDLADRLLSGADSSRPLPAPAGRRRARGARGPARRAADPRP
jgi:glycine oxidase